MGIRRKFRSLMDVHNKGRIDRFIVRRAFRAGRVTRAEVAAAFALSPATATRFMARAEAAHSAVLMRDGHALVPRLLAEPPAFASEEDLLKQLDTGCVSFPDIGLTSAELPVRHVRWTDSMPLRPGILAAVVAAIHKRSLLLITYLGLRRNGQPRVFLVLPLGLECMNDQWRVIAHDLEREGYPIRPFVLPRILETRLATRRKPPGLVAGTTDDRMVAVPVDLSGALTDLQRKVVAHELRVADGVVHIPARSVCEFLRRFTDQPPGDELVWPLLRRR